MSVGLRTRLTFSVEVNKFRNPQHAGAAPGFCQLNWIWLFNTNFWLFACLCSWFSIFSMVCTAHHRCAITVTNTCQQKQESKPGVNVLNFTIQVYVSGTSGGKLWLENALPNQVCVSGNFLCHYVMWKHCQKELKCTNHCSVPLLTGCWKCCQLKSQSQRTAIKKIVPQCGSKVVYPNSQE